jgi:hypothetical protein
MAVEVIIEELKNKNRLKDRVVVMIFPCIIRVLTKKSWSPDGNTIHKDFEFTQENMLEFIFYINDCFNLKKFKKYINNDAIDVEAELCAFLANIYISNQNGIYKLKK